MKFPAVQRGGNKSVFGILNIQHMRPNVACSDGDTDFQVSYWTIDFVFIDSMRP